MESNIKYEVRFKDIDPDTGFISQDKLICICETEKIALWIVDGLNLTLSIEGEPNREIYLISKLISV